MDEARDTDGRVDGRPLVVLDSVNKWFGDLHVLKDINLTVDRGEVLVVIGPSGSGKSTLCRTINRLEPIDKGSITIDGVSLTIAASRGRRVEIALVPHTLTATTLGSLAPGDTVNVEVDVLAKHVERLLQAHGGLG